MMRFISKSVLFLFWAALSHVSIFAQSGGVTGMPCNVEDTLVTPYFSLSEWLAQQDPCCGQFIRYDVCYDIDTTRIYSDSVSCRPTLISFSYPGGVYSGHIDVPNVADLADAINQILRDSASAQWSVFSAYPGPKICADTITSDSFGLMRLVCGNDTIDIMPDIKKYNFCPVNMSLIGSAFSGILDDKPYDDITLFNIPGNGTSTVVTTSQIINGSIWDLPDLGPGEQLNPNALPSDNDLGHLMNALFGSGIIGAAGCNDININCYLDDLTNFDLFNTSDVSLDTAFLDAGTTEEERDQILNGLNQWRNSLQQQGSSLSSFINNALGWNLPDTPCPGAGGNLRGAGKDTDPEAAHRAKVMPPAGSQTEADPDYFSQDIPGIGAGTMSPPTPSALAAIQAISGGVNLYNGAQSTSIPLHTLQAYDISVPVSISSSNNGLKVDDMGGPAGQHWSIQAGGEITRVVKGLPDDFNGTLQGIGVGQQTIYTPRFEIPSNVGVHVPLLLPNTPTEMMRTGLERKVNLGEVIKLIIRMVPHNPTMLTYSLRIPIFTIPFTDRVVSLEIGLSAGFGKSTFLMPIEYREKVLGYQHIDDAGLMGDMGLPALQEDILPNDEADKLKVLKAIHPGSKRDEHAVVSDIAGTWAAIKATHEVLVNGRPIHRTNRIDVQPDEYHFTAGGYSGKFFIKPNGQVLLTPYQPDVTISVIYNSGQISAFFIRTPDGMEYTFGNQYTDQTRDINYMLPNMYAYPEEDNTRTRFLQAQIDVSVIEKFPILGKLSLSPYGNTYDRNYKITNGPQYNSAWHLTQIKSVKTQEVVTFQYRQRQNLSYFSGKSYSHTFPDFGLMPGPIATTVYRGQHNPIHNTPTRWENGRADFTYSATQTTQNRWDLERIRSNRGEHIAFLYEEPKGEIVGDSVCTQIRVMRGGNVENTRLLYRGWRLVYKHTQSDEVAAEILCPAPQSDDSWTPVQMKKETVFKLGKLYKPTFRDYNRYFKIIFTIGKLNVPIRLRLPFAVIPRNIPHRNEMSETGSLLEVRTLAHKSDRKFFLFSVGYNRMEWLDFDGVEQSNIFQAEGRRTFLQDIKEIDQNEELHAFVGMEYHQQASLPKRFSVHQDQYGYPNDNTVSGSPFPLKNTDANMEVHYGFYNKGTGSGSMFKGRAAPDFAYTRRGALTALNMASGAKISYTYEPNVMDDTGTPGAGIRVAQKKEDPVDLLVPAKITTYKYEKPSVNTLPVFVSSNPKDRYYRADMEMKVVSTSHPQNIMLPNRANIVGYATVTEDWGQYGSVVHHYSTPDNFSSHAQIDIPFGVSSPSYDCNKNTRAGIFDPGGLINDFFCTGDVNTSPGIHIPDVRRLSDIFFGLELQTETKNQTADVVVQTQDYKAIDYKRGREDDKIILFNSSVYQLNYYGTFAEVFARGLITQYLPFLIGEEGMESHIDQLWNLIFGNTALGGRSITRRFETATYDYPAINVVMTRSQTTETFINDINSLPPGLSLPAQTETTEITNYNYLADPGNELLLDAQITSYSDGNSVRTKYHYPFQPTTEAVLAVHDASARTYLNTNGYRQPVASETFVNSIPVEANVTALTLEGNKIAPKANYGLQNGNFVLLGKFDGYNSDAKPERYILAKFGANNASASSEFFEPIHLEWDNRLHLTSRRYLDFLTTNQFSGFFEYAGTTDNNNVKTEITYDARGRVASVSKLNGHEKTSYEYLIGPQANAIKMNTHYRTGEDMNLMQYLDGLGKETKLFRLNDGARLNEKTYDSFWRPVAEYNIGSGVTNMTYENSPLSRLLRTKDAVNNVVTQRYFGQPEADTYTGTAVTDPNGHTSTSHYNSLGKLRKTVAGISANVPVNQQATVLYAYDNLQRLTTITNPIGETFLYEYNDMGLVWRTTVPGRGPQSTWYDHKFRPVATRDGNGKLIINQYDIQDRLWKSFLFLQSDNPPSLAESGNLRGIHNNDLSSFFTDNTKRLSELKYTADGSTWVEESHNRLLRQMPETAPPFMVRSRHDLDDIGRAVASTVTYPDASLTQNTDYSSAGFVKRSTREVYHNTSGATQRIIDIFSHDNVLRPEKHRIQYGPNEDNDFVMANHLVYDEHDRLIKKFVGTAPGDSLRFLQEVNYAYDAISRLLRINDPGTFGCNIGEEVCELSLELKLPKKTLEEGHCRRLQAIKVDNLTYTLPAPLALTAVGQAPAITAAIQQALDLFGLDGTANLVDIRNDADYFYFTFAVTGTLARNMSLVLESCDQSPAFSSDCCIIAPITVPPAVQNNGLPFSTCADLYHQRMRYSGLDIANITLGSSCDARLVNNYSYDALHRITAMHNSLIRPGLDADNAYSTSYSYDPAGNIQRLTRRGFVGMSGNAPVYDLIDDLHYSYAGANPAANAFSSVLQGVADVVTDPAAQPRGVFLPSSGYIPDGNGNLRTAGSVTAEYNILNLPTKLATPGGERKFEYVFGGGKYSAQLITGLPAGQAGNPAIDETRHYLGGMEFKDGVLEAYNFGDGRVVFHDSVPTLRFQYRLHDHLGNTTVFFEDKNNNGCITTEEEATSPADLEIVQRLLYYPFGMALEGLGAWNAQPWQQYRYNGKERDTLTGWYDYGARWGLLDIGRWNGVDPLGDRRNWVSPYNYVQNNPISMVDPTGMLDEPPINGLEFFTDNTGVYYWNKNNGNYDRYYTIEGSDQIHVGTYSADKFKEPVGNYTIIFDLSLEKSPDKYSTDNTIWGIAGPLMAYLASEKKPLVNISDSKRYPGVEIYSHPDLNGAITLGNMIFTNPGMEDSNTLDHEYGHYLDFKFHFNYDKTAYLKEIGVPSFISALSKGSEHEKSVSEKRANRLGGAWANNEYLKNIFRQ